jgi:hypothetical protein
VSPLSTDYGGCEPSASGQDLGEQAAERVADEDRRHVQPADDFVEVVCNLSDGLMGEDLGVRLRSVDGLGIVGPAAGGTGL